MNQITFKADWANAIIDLTSDLETVREIVDGVDTYDTDAAFETYTRAEKELAGVLSENRHTFERILGRIQDEIDERCGSWDSQNREACAGDDARHGWAGGQPI